MNSLASADLSVSPSVSAPSPPPSFLSSDVGCKTVANMIKGKTPEEIRKLFNIQNDFTPEEEAQIRKENEWAEGWSRFRFNLKGVAS